MATVRSPPAPIGPELQLRTEWGVIASTEWELIQEELLPAYRAAVRASPKLPRSLGSTLTSMRSEMRRRAPKRTLRASARQAIVSVNATSATVFDAQASIAVGRTVTVNPPALSSTLASAVNTASAQIGIVRDQSIPALRLAVRDAWARGLTAEELEAQLRKGLPLPFGTVEGRTGVIARAQLGGLNGTLSEDRMRAMGGRSYTWITMGDGRVRPAHRRRLGKRYSWRRPPPGGHPGEAVACRCRAQAKLDERKIAQAPGVSL